MRPVLFMKREIVQGLEVGSKLHSPDIWKNPMMAEKLLQAGFSAKEDLIVCYVTFADDYAFIGKERGSNPKGTSQNETKSDSARPGADIGQ